MNNDSININYHKTKIGELILASYKDQLCLLDYRYRRMRKAIDNRIINGLNADYIEKDDELLKKTRKQIDEYLLKKRKEFTIPIITVGTEFQKNVWNALVEIKYGETASYKELATRINNKKAVRAVASANGANAIGLIIPCHRIIGSNGKLVGYAGGLSTKKRLLKLEEKSFSF